MHDRTGFLSWSSWCSLTLVVFLQMFHCLTRQHLQCKKGEWALLSVYILQFVLLVLVDVLFSPWEFLDWAVVCCLIELIVPSLGSIVLFSCSSSADPGVNLCISGC